MAGTFSPELGGVNPRPIGFPHHGWLLVRPVKYTLTGPNTSSNKNHKEEYNSRIVRGCRAFIKGSNSGDPTDTSVEQYYGTVIISDYQLQIPLHFSNTTKTEHCKYHLNLLTQATIICM